MSFPASAIVSSNAEPQDQAALVATIVGAWRAYTRVDARALRFHLADDCIRMSGRWGAGMMQRGADTIVRHLRAEAAAYERPAGVLAEEHIVSNAELWVDASRSVATALYWDSGPSGYRWCDAGQGVVLQVLSRDGDRWRIAHWTETFDTSYDLATNAPGTERFHFDFSYPVDDLSRAVDFYSPILGPPESLEPERSVFVLNRGSRFVLDASGLRGLARTSPGLPNGWATIFVDDVRAERQRLRHQGVRFVDGAHPIVAVGPDLSAIGIDEPDHNPFVLMQRNYSEDGPSPSAPSGLSGESSGVATVREIATAWVGMDVTRIDSLYGSTGRLFDNTRIKTRGFEIGSDVGSALAQLYWPRYDRSQSGLSVDLHATDVETRDLGERIVVSYVQQLTGTGPHPFRETALVTHLLDADARPLVSFTTTGNAAPTAKVLGPDYIGYPTTSVRKAEQFYSDTMRFGAPYVDRAYRGWWSENGSVFGVYAARPSRDAIPRPNLPSAYNSFWVRSAEELYSYLRRRDVRFPVIPAITGRAGIQDYPGYRQVVATDSEGNLVVFTEYTGT